MMIDSVEIKRPTDSEIMTRAKEVGKRVVIKIKKRTENTEVDEGTDTRKKIEIKSEIKIGKEEEIAISLQGNVQGITK